jgi:hypothetical protein
MKFLKNNQALVALAAMYILYVLIDVIWWKKGVATDPQNLRNILSQNSYTGIIAVGMTLVIIGGGIDLSVGSLMGLLGVLSILALNKPADDPTKTIAAIVVGVGAGALIGFANGVIITWGKIAPFVATLAGLVGFRSLALALTDARSLTSSSKDLFPGLAQGGSRFPAPLMPLDALCSPTGRSSSSSPSPLLAPGFSTEAFTAEDSSPLEQTKPRPSTQESVPTKSESSPTPSSASVPESPLCSKAPVSPEPTPHPLAKSSSSTPSPQLLSAAQVSTEARAKSGPRWSESSSSASSATFSLLAQSIPTGKAV